MKPVRENRRCFEYLREFERFEKSLRERKDDTRSKNVDNFIKQRIAAMGNWEGQALQAGFVPTMRGIRAQEAIPKAFTNLPRDQGRGG